MKNGFKLAKGSLNNIFQDSLNKSLSQQLSHDRSYMYERQAPENCHLLFKNYVHVNHYSIP